MILAAAFTAVALMMVPASVVSTATGLPTRGAGLSLPAASALQIRTASSHHRPPGDPAADTASVAALPGAGAAAAAAAAAGLEEGSARDAIEQQRHASQLPDTTDSSADEHLVGQGCTFFLVRHGQSHPNVAGKIVSGMEEGVDPANGLTELGLEQARTAGKELKEVLLGAGCSPANTMVVTSPFSRAKETAEAIRECLDCDLREERDLRERYFGELDGREDHASYAKVWALDAVSARHGELGVEPAAQVAERAAAVVRRLRKEISIRQRYYSGDDGQPFPPGPSAVVLVSHGDALQLLQCALAGRPAEQHRSLPHLENCGIRVLRPPPGEEGVREAGGVAEEDEGGGRGAEAAAEAFRMTGARVFRAPAGGEDDGGGRGEGGGWADGER